MTFPRPDTAPFTAVSCRIVAGKERAALLSRISHLTKKLKVPQRPGHQASATIFLGLCYLRQCQEAKTQQSARDEIIRADMRFLPESGGSQGTNVSHYAKDPEGKIKEYINHRFAIDAAMGVFYPEIRSLRKKCFLLMELGSRHWHEVSVALLDEAWIATDLFEPFDFDD